MGGIRFRTAKRLCCYYADKFFRRPCPLCGKVLKYKRLPARWSCGLYRNDGNITEILKKNSLCSTCAHIPFKTIFKGKGNPFYGQKHSRKTRQFLSKISRGLRRSLATEFSKTNVGNRKSFYECWLLRYGKEEADKRLNRFRCKQSFNNRGKKNSMFGKPSPVGSGNGWSGWYKNWYFRSILELSYLIHNIEVQGQRWQSGEQSSLGIRYKNHKGIERTYFADFLVEGKYLVECKPRRLFKSLEVKSKARAAKKFCQKQGLHYILIEPTRLSREEIVSLFRSGKIKFLPRYEKKFKEKYLND
jgi:hypothetical protein